ncbi:MAG TPA: hypothetical protein VM692_16270 [Gammaproteobacteria bacterium]|nr:hypothetical protein [Gammaproteobacteria bacterium]
MTLLALVVFLLPGRSTAAGLADELQDQVQEILSRDGPYSQRLLEPLTTLGLHYQESNDLLLALATLERAVQIVRINSGLHTLEQVPLTRQLIRIEEARGNDTGAWQREQKLLTLLRRHLDDLQTVPVLREIADKQMEVLNAVLAGARPVQVLLGCFYQEWPHQDSADCHSGSRKTVIQGMLAEAQRNYADAIGVLLQHGLYASDELRDLELRVLRGVDLLRTRNEDPSFGYPVPMVPPYLNTASIEPWRSRIAPVAALAEWQPPQHRALAEHIAQGVSSRQVEMMSPYQRGRQSLERIYEYGAASSSPSLSQADAIVQLADWDLLHSHNGQALQSYTAAYAMLEQAGTAPASIAQLFSPEMPVVLPAFQPNPLLSNETRPPTGHIDVAFEITQYGRGREIEVRDAANATAEETERLVSLIKSNRFRPRLTDGHLAAAAPVVLRYYVYE